MIEIKFKKLHPAARLPQRMTRESIGLDIFAHLLTESGRNNNMLIPTSATRNVPTGLLIEPPKGYYLVVCSRSGLAERSIIVANAPGIIDPDYRGELRVLLYNGSHQAHYVHNEDRIAQLIPVPISYGLCVATEFLSPSDRGANGLGSTGI